MPQVQEFITYGAIFSALIGLVIWYFKKDNQATTTSIAEVSKTSQEIKSILNVYMAKQEHILEEVKILSATTRENTKEINENYKYFTDKIHELQLANERMKNQLNNQNG